MPRPNAKDPHGFLEPSNTRQPVQQCARRYLPAATDLLPERSDNVLHSSMKAFVPRRVQLWRGCTELQRHRGNSRVSVTDMLTHIHHAMCTLSHASASAALSLAGKHSNTWLLQCCNVNLPGHVCQDLYTDVQEAKLTRQHRQTPEPE